MTHDAQIRRYLSQNVLFSIKMFPLPVFLLHRNPVSSILFPLPGFDSTNRTNISNKSTLNYPCLGIFLKRNKHHKKHVKNIMLLL